jgi:hypothetical protein
MLKSKVGWTLALALALAVPSFSTAFAVNPKATATGEETAPSTSGLSKEDQEKLKEHNKLRSQIKGVKYPAPKATIVAKVKGIKPDDKKWFTDTLPDKTYTSADEVFTALGWETTPPATK